MGLKEPTGAELKDRRDNSTLLCAPRCTGLVPGTVYGIVPDTLKGSNHLSPAPAVCHLERPIDGRHKPESNPKQSGR